VSIQRSDGQHPLSLRGGSGEETTETTGSSLRASGIYRFSPLRGVCELGGGSGQAVEGKEHP